jgi:predicted dehydrogenase
VRILIAGLGAIGQRHARNLRMLLGDRLELLAYRQRRLPFVVTEALQRDDRRDVEAELGVRVYDDLDRALAAGVDAVFVCTPSSQHLAIAQRAADHGCHLFIEKPVSHTLDGLEALGRRVSQQNLVVLVGCQWRFHPQVRWLRDMVRAEALGRIDRVEIDYGEYLPDWHPYEDYRTSYAARAALGGGVVLTQIHDYDLAWWIFGPARQVTASGGRLSTLEVDVEDTVDARIDCARARVRVRQTFASPRAYRSIAVHGDSGKIEIDLLSGRAQADGAIAQPEDLTGYRRNEMFLAEARHFTACIAGCETPDIPLADGVAVLQLALAVKASMQTGVPVETH